MNDEIAKEILEYIDSQIGGTDLDYLLMGVTKILYKYGIVIIFDD